MAGRGPGPCAAVSAMSTSAATLVLGACALVAGCGTRSLGECDRAAAEELVFSPSGHVATKGQALTNDSCGNAAFCHSAAATGDERFGAPSGMNFDMLPSPTGLLDLLDEAESAWHVVSEGEMPPGKLGSDVMGDGQWTVDVTGLGVDAPALPSLKTEQGKAAFRNWLACGAPSVTDTETPGWAHAPSPGIDGGTGFEAIYAGIVAPRCGLSGCHDASGQAGGLVLADPCGAHAALLGKGDCGKTYVLPGDAEGSFLIDKLESDLPSCGGPMPPTGALPQELRDAVYDWIDSGAPGVTCP